MCGLCLPGCPATCADVVQEGSPIISFDFRKLHFILDAEDGMFRKLKYPTKVQQQAALRAQPTLFCGP
jgi:hypothetical protein